MTGLPLRFVVAAAFFQGVALGEASESTPDTATAPADAQSKGIQADDRSSEDHPPSSPASVSLTSANFKELTKGKTVFIKFYAPWCPHCKELAPAWEELAKDWVDHPVGLVGEVDCTAEQSLCEEHDIEGLPTLLFGDPTGISSEMEQYAGDNSATKLRSFAKKTLAVPICSPANLDACDDVNRKEMLRFMTMSEEEIVGLIEEGE
eukprot:CAMPEP_0197460318 /NCGR_PEP_ID=MMETSP1175-20131217/53749_1 /TAXON_ID=1003142 /ORGANISM="Triceratium dubium, Strain CCMP147" /LENGTH=205 /DNA_ID=CAMNT_0042995387 /DNA_START=31 /DNA_END=645 /DNA_ORIENTATION=-